MESGWCESSRSTHRLQNNEARFERKRRLAVCMLYCAIGRDLHQYSLGKRTKASVYLMIGEAQLLKICTMEEQHHRKSRRWSRSNPLWQPHIKVEAVLAVPVLGIDRTVPLHTRCFEIGSFPCLVPACSWLWRFPSDETERSWNGRCY